MKTMTYLLNLTLLVVCSQFVFADDANTDGKQVYISFEDAQAALTDKDTYDEGAYRKENPPHNGDQSSSRDCTNDDSSSDSYGDTCSSWYDANESDGSYGCSGGYNDDDFDAAAQCCSCGGGTQSSSGPGWEDTPSAYEFTSVMNAQILEDGSAIAEEGDILAAFDAAGNVRGVSSEQMGIGAYTGQIIHEIIIRSNAAGDVITFQYYDVSEDEVLDISESYDFAPNDNAATGLGSLIDPYALNIGGPDLSCPECPACEDDDVGVGGGGCAWAVGMFGCDMAW